MLHTQQILLHRTPYSCSHMVAASTLASYSSAAAEHLSLSHQRTHCTLLHAICTERIIPGIDPDLPAAPRSENDIHIIFSTDCSASQHWQAMLLSYSAVRVGHTGPMTRIASNCTDAEVRALLLYS
jgi:hypothetical protein